VKSIIEDIQKATNATVMATEEGNKGVDLGLQHVSQARSAIDSLGSAVNNNAQMARQVLGGGRQQQTGIEQISMAMQNINQATVQSLQSTRQAETAAQRLNELAQKMSVVLEKY
jgi:methyl-accepting chemotaxis protein